MDRKIEHIVRLRSGGVCEYCRLPQSVSHLPFPLDHIIARQHQGSSTDENLAVACPACNLHKGPNIAGLDPSTGELTALFHPRQHRWDQHFQWNGAFLEGRTAIGRTTIQVLAINEASHVALRLALMQDGVFPRDATQRAGEEG